MPRTTHTLIIGGTHGIGWVLAEQLASNGNKVSVIGRTSPLGKKPRGIRAWQVDLLDPTQVTKALDAILAAEGKLNGLVCLQRFKSDGDKWTGEIATSLTATRQVIEHLANHFCPRQNNSIVLVSSAASSVVAMEQGVGYHVAKAGLNQMARYYAVALGAKGIRVNVVSPGTVLKPENRAFYLRNKKLLQTLQRTIPLGRMGTAVEIAEAIEFLLSSRAAFVTGQVLLVDGGVNLLSSETLARTFANQA